MAQYRSLTNLETLSHDELHIRLGLSVKFPECIRLVSI